MIAHHSLNSPLRSCVSITLPAYWEVIADNLSKAGWNCGCISSTDHKEQQLWVAAAEREDAGRFIVRADERLTPLMELESTTRSVARRD